MKIFKLKIILKIKTNSNNIKILLLEINLLNNCFSIYILQL